MHTTLEISRSDLEYNAKAVCGYVKTPVIAVVKCNGYGIGIENAVAAWKSAGVNMFAVAEADEAFAVHECAPDAEILLMSPLKCDETVEALLKCGVILTVSDSDSAAYYASFADRFRVRVHLKLDTGMGRFGVRYDDKDELSAVYKEKSLEYCGVFSHFALSFESGEKATRRQFDRFMSAVEIISKLGVNPGMRHIANSCAALRFDWTRLDAVRIGSALVGRLIAPAPLELKKIGVLKTPVAALKPLKSGDTSGYASIFHAKHDISCAVVEIGYRSGFGMERKADTFRFTDILRSVYHDIRAYKVLPSVRFDGHRFSVVGRIGNQYTLVDNTSGRLSAGDIVEADVNLLFVDSEIERVIV